MKELEKQNFICGYAHQDESKSHIEEQGKLLDEVGKRFDVSFADASQCLLVDPQDIGMSDKPANQCLLLANGNIAVGDGNQGCSS
jgi:hypothetical protein